MLAIEREQQLDDLGPRGRVEVAGGLVGQDELRPQRQRARDRHPLLLTARELTRIVVGTVDESHGVEKLASSLGPARLAGQLERHRDVVERGESRDQVIGLEHDADAIAPQARQRIFVEARPGAPESHHEVPHLEHHPTHTTLGS